MNHSIKKRVEELENRGDNEIMFCGAWLGIECDADSPSITIVWPWQLHERDLTIEVDNEKRTAQG